MSIVIESVCLYGEGNPVDVVIDQGIITDIGTDLSYPAGAQRIDANQQILLPGLVDLHTHLREPGREYAEDIQTGSQAAALGGYTAICAMPNTTPVADCAAITDYVFNRGQQVGLVDVYPVGAITTGLQGQQLAEMATMASGVAQVRMFSDDGHCVGDPQLMRRALEYSVGLDAIIAQHAEETRLTVGAVAHDGPTAARLGLAGWPRSAEESIVARDILLAKETQARLHICHVSTAGTAELVQWAKNYGVRITAEVAPHHLFLDDSVLDSYDGVNRVNPPLREQSDTEALRTALAQGIIDCVATDHAPHADYEKNCEFDRARPGMLGLQTALSIIVKTMVLSGMMTWRDLARVMSEKPAQILGLSDQGRPIEIGEPANLVVVNPHTQWVVDSTKLASKSHNTPYQGMTLPASVTATLLRGRLTTYQGQCTQ